jgi:hypothetical protein
MMHKLFAGFCILWFCILSLALTARANEVITNGGFETGDFTGWTVTDTGGAGSFFVCPNAGAFPCPSNQTPLSGLPTVGPAGGSFYAVSDQFGPGSHAITQSFTALAGMTYQLSFDMFVNDWATFNSAPTQFGGEADLLAGGALPLGPALDVFYQADTQVDPTTGLPNPWVHTSLDITADLTPGLTYQLRFLESDSTAPLNVGADNVSLMASAVPEPNLLAFPVAFLAGIVLYRSRRKTNLV